jgi:hypothetical protein
MNKLNRDIDITKVNQSKERTMNFVINEVEVYQKPWYHVFKVLSFKIAVPIVFAVFVLGLIFVNNPSSSTPTPNAVLALSEEDKSTLAEMSYLSGTIIAYAFDTAAHNTTFLNSEATTTFETDIEEFNQYFELLKLYLDDASLDDNIVITELEDNEFDILISFNNNNQVYDMYLNSADESSFEGELVIDGLVFTVTGEITNEGEETKLDLEAKNGNDSVTIEYESELSDEIETNYKITSNINGTKKIREIKVEMDGEEAKVEIKENESTYELSREIEDGNVTYKLSYQLGETEGEAIITEVTNASGVTGYRYHIEEDDVEKDIETNKPDIPKGRDDDDRGNPFNDDDEDDEDDEMDDQSHFDNPNNVLLESI